MRGSSTAQRHTMSRRVKHALRAAAPPSIAIGLVGVYIVLTRWSQFADDVLVNLLRSRNDRVQGIVAGSRRGSSHLRMVRALRDCYPCIRRSVLPPTTSQLASPYRRRGNEFTRRHRCLEAIGLALRCEAQRRHEHIANSCRSSATDPTRRRTRDLSLSVGSPLDADRGTARPIPAPPVHQRPGRRAHLPAPCERSLPRRPSAVPHREARSDGEER